MSAQTKWWFCGQCGFKNHPRGPANGSSSEELAKKCEQCGAGRDDENATDYKAGS